MNGAAETLKKRNVTAEWNMETGQNYAEYTEDGVTYKIWLEDVDSLHERLKVIAGADVAGVAAWRLGYETEEIWPIIKNYPRISCLRPAVYKGLQVYGKRCSGKIQYKY